MSFYRNRVYPHIVTVLGNPRPVQEIPQQFLPLAQGAENESPCLTPAWTPSSAPSPCVRFQLNDDCRRIQHHARSAGMALPPGTPKKGGVILRAVSIRKISVRTVQIKPSQ